MTAILRALVFLATIGRAVAFVCPAKISSTQPYKTSATSRVSSNLVSMPEISELTNAAITSSSHVLSRLFTKEMDPEDARSQFFFFFFAGSGAGGIGLAQIPRLYQEIQEINDLAKFGPSQGGAALTTGPLVSLLYSSPLYEKDVAQVISKIPSAAKISAQGTSESYVASLGYIVQSDFVAACSGKGKTGGCNPYVASLVFEAMTGGKGKCVDPDEVDAKTALYKSSVQNLLKDLQGAAATKLTSYGTLAFLLFLTFDLIVESGIQGFGS
jgi:hypothetical protein